MEEVIDSGLEMLTVVICLEIAFILFIFLFFYCVLIVFAV